MDGICEVTRATIEPPPRNGGNAPVRKRPAPETIPENRRAPAGLASDLRGLLYAGQLRLRAMSVSGANEEMGMS